MKITFRLAVEFKHFASFRIIFISLKIFHYIAFLSHTCRRSSMQQMYCLASRANSMRLPEEYLLMASMGKRPSVSSMSSMGSNISAGGRYSPRWWPAFTLILSFFWGRGNLHSQRNPVPYVPNVQYSCSKETLLLKQGICSSLSCNFGKILDVKTFDHKMTVIPRVALFTVLVLVICSIGFPKYLFVTLQKCLHVFMNILWTLVPQ